MIHFLLDSTSAIPESYLEQHENVHVVPLTISINQEYIPEFCQGIPLMYLCLLVQAVF